MFIGVISTVLFFFDPSTSSSVIDTLSQKGLHLAKYCPKVDYCDEGTHVMCMYYDPKRPMGPRCSNPQNISMTADLAAKLLDVSNAVRRKIALGKETGKNGPLPRGYGIFRLSWDEELATFAQVLANQCVLRRDLCRATDKFPSPSQAVGLVRFTYPDWLPVSNKSHFTTTKLIPEKLNYAITQTLRTWYSQKVFVTDDMIASTPDWVKNIKDQRGRLYLMMISGSATHMGCGVSAYSAFGYHDNNSPLNYNSVQIVCNYSARPRPGQPVYTTTPPTEVGYTLKCGCPDGYDEDEGCLCYESRRKLVTHSTPPPNYCADGTCTPAVVLLPIITVEDAPPHKLLAPGFDASQRPYGNSVDISNHQDSNYRRNEKAILEPQSLNEFSKLLREPDIARFEYDSQPSVQQYLPENSKQTDGKRTQSSLLSLSHVPQRHSTRQSIFSRAAKFQLPNKKRINSYRITNKEIKKDVAPRRDFSNVQKLLQTYLNNKHNLIGNAFNPNYFQYDFHEPKVVLKPKMIFEHISTNSPVETSQVVNPERHQQTKQNTDKEGVNLTNDIKELGMKDPNEETDKKFMILLNNLEKEVKHVELDPTDKVIFDARIRKIYNTVVGNKLDMQLKEIRLLNDKTHEKEINDNLINYELAADTEFKKRKMNDETLFTDKKSNVYDGNRLIERDQNEIRNSNNNYRKLNNEFSPPIDRDDDHLSYERRKYYQEKLDNLQRKLQSVRRSGHHNANSPRQVRPVRPTKTSAKDMVIRPSKFKKLDTFYIPEKARFIHGF